MTAAAIVYEIESTGMAYKRLSRRLRSLPPPEKATVVRVVTGIRPIPTFDSQGLHYTVLSLSEYPHEHQVRPQRSGGWRCSCPSFVSGCWHLETVADEVGLEGEPPEITEWRREHR